MCTASTCEGAYHANGPERSIIVTGGNAGLGFQCARFIGADRSVLVVLACRDARLGNEAAARLKQQGVAAAALPLDLASLASVRAFAARVREGKLPPLAGLVCNAGLQNVGPPGRTADGFETTFAVNHLGHFLLANLLLPEMAENGRIVFVASGVHDPAEKTGLPAPRYESARAVADDAEQAGGEAGRRRYSTSKLLNIYCTYELARRLDGAADPRLRSIRVNAFDPGMMPGTGLARGYPAPLRFAWRYVMPALTLFKRNVHSASKSGKRLADLATGGYGAVTGKYLSDGRETRSSTLSYDAGNARDLWETSAVMAGIDPVIGGGATARPSAESVASAG